MGTITRERYTIPGLNILALEITEWRERQGFTMPASINETDLLMSRLALVHSEVSEALEAVRVGDLWNFREEIADTFIRLLDMTAALGVDIEAEIRGKMLRNEMRPHKHGKRA